jgi:glycosyltransferase involved in cell wall biosynthesis
MKIGIDARLWDQTGVGRYIRNLCINLQKIDKKNQYIIFARSRDLESIKSKINNSNWRIVKTDIRWHSIAEQINFSKVIDKENLDLMHFPYFSLPIFYKKPYVVTIHDLIINHFPTGKASTLFPIFYYLKLFSYKYIIYMGAKNAKKIITPSNATKEEVIDHLRVDSKKIIVTPEAADENISKESNLQALKQISGKYFLSIGNAYPHKNLEKLLDAFKDVKKDIDDVKLVLVGNNDYFYERIKKRVDEMDISKDVVFFGKATDNELSYLYKNAVCLVMPSLMEGFGLPVLEAMANKCLVICSNIPSLREIAKDNAIYFSPSNLEEIKQALKKAYKKDYNIEILENAFNESKKFSWEKTAKETLKVYESCISLR